MNTQIKMFFVVSKLAKGHCGSSRSSRNKITSKHTIINLALTLLALTTGIFFSLVSFATEINVYGFKPTDSIELIMPNTNNNLIGSFSSIRQHAVGSQSMTLGDAWKNNLSGLNSELIEEKNIFKIESQNEVIVD